MRADVVITAALALGAPALAAADPRADTAVAYSGAIADGDPAAASKLYAAKVKLHDLVFDDPACDKAFGRSKPHTVGRKQHGKLAACLIGQPTWPDGGPSFHIGGTPPRVDAIWVERTEVDAAEGDDASAVVDPSAGGAGTPPPPPPRPTIEPSVLEPLRLQGDLQIVPDAATKKAIKAAHKTRVAATYELCIDRTGAVAQVIRLESSGFKDYDAKIDAAMHGWAYQPYVVDGEAQPVCTAVTFVYAQK